MNTRNQWILGAAVSVIALALTWFLDDFFLFRLALVASWAVAVLGLNLLTGFNGQISLGHGTFMGIGMYTVAITNRDWNLSYPLAFLLTIAICLVVGALIGIPALRLPGTSLALITLAMALAFPQLLRKYDSITGGVQGIGISGESQFLSPTDSLSNDQARYLVVVAITIGVFFVGWNLTRGRWGLAMMAVRDNPVAAASMGVNLPRTKVVTFAISGALAGLGGAMQMMLNNYVAPESISLAVSISLLTGIVIGGLGTVAGALIGGIFIQYLPIWSQTSVGRPPARRDPGRDHHPGDDPGARWDHRARPAAAGVRSPPTRSLDQGRGGRGGRRLPDHHRRARGRGPRRLTDDHQPHLISSHHQQPHKGDP